MKKIVIIAAIMFVAIAAGSFVLFNGTAKADAPSAPPVPPPGYFTVIVHVQATVDQECLEKCLDQVALWRSDGAIQYQPFVYNTWYYTFYSRAPFAGTLWAGVTTKPNCACLTIVAATVTSRWTQTDIVYMTIYVD